MRLVEFKASLEQSNPPDGLGGPLSALWWDAKGEWDYAHRIVQTDQGADAAWVHAYLHRKEGDAFNAGYWYGRAGKPHSRHTLAREWAEIAEALLSEIGRESR